MKRIIALILIICTVIPFASCDKTPNNPEEITTSKLNLANYRIIMPQRQSNAYKEVCNDFVKNFKNKSGLDLEYTDDFVKENTELFYEAECEILLGDTNREESKIDATNAKNSYVIKYDNKKIVINAENPYALEFALNEFLVSYVKENETMIEIPARSGTFNSSKLYFNNLENITLTGLGDSYLNPGDIPQEDLWITMLADKYGMKLNNNGIGGSTVSEYTDDGKFHNPMVNRLHKLPVKTDIILFEGGRNDRNHKVPMGELDSRDTFTFAGACNYILDELQEKYPNALIICITTWYVGDGTENYAETMKKICKERNIVCFDATNQAITKVEMDDKDFRAKYCKTASDVSHLNADGMKLVLPAFEKFIGEQYDKFLSNK